MFKATAKLTFVLPESNKKLYLIIPLFSYSSVQSSRYANCLSKLEHNLCFSLCDPVLLMICYSVGITFVLRWIADKMCLLFCNDCFINVHFDAYMMCCVKTHNDLIFFIT